VPKPGTVGGGPGVTLIWLSLGVQGIYCISIK
jgi:hypothetical protein